MWSLNKVRVKPFEKGKGIPPQTPEIVKNKPYVRKGEKPKTGRNWMPLLRGSLINRYINLWNNNYWISYGKWLAAPRDSKIFEALEKIVVRQTGDRLIATMVNNKYIQRNNLHIILLKERNDLLLYLLALINSKLMDYFYWFINPEKGEALAEVKKRHLEILPIVILEKSKEITKINKIVSQMLETQKQFQAATSEGDKAVYKQKIDLLDKQIDDLVYKLYDLTDEEIKIVEESLFS